MGQENNNPQGLPVVSIAKEATNKMSTKTVQAVPYFASDLRVAIDEYLATLSLKSASQDFIPNFCKKDEKGRRYMAIFSQSFTVRQSEDLNTAARGIYRKIERTVLKIDEQGNTVREHYANDDKGQPLYRDAIEKVVSGWKSVKLVPMVNEIPTVTHLPVFFTASEGLKVGQIVVLACNTLRMLCDNAKEVGKAAPVRKTAGLHIAFGEVNTSKLGQGIRCGLMFTDLNQFVSAMVKRAKRSLNNEANTTLQAGTVGVYEAEGKA